MIIPLSLGRRSNRSRHGHEGGSGLVNCYAEDIGEEGKSRFAIYAHDGATQWGSVTDNGIRAMQALDTSLYVVAGRTINRVDTSGAATVIGGLIGDGLVTMAANRAATAQVGICADGIFKIATEDGVVDVTDADLPPANSVINFDGFFILTIEDGRIFSTALEDGTSIDGLDFTKAEANRDGLVRGFVRGRDACFFGTETTEFYQNAGAASGFPLTRTTSIDVGCMSGASVAAVDQTVAWVADDGTVRMLSGYQAQVISSYDIERLIDDEPDKDSITGFSWQRRGHTFYQISGSAWTKVFDLGTQKWHDRKGYGLSRHRYSSHAKFNGLHLFGDYATNALYSVSPTVHTEAGQPIVMEVEMPPTHAYPYRMTHNQLRIDAIPGVGLNSTDTHNSDPLVMLDYSTDGGSTFGAERQMSLGVQGNTKARLIARRLGQSNEDGRVYRIRVSAEVVRGITMAYIDAEKDEA